MRDEKHPMNPAFALEGGKAGESIFKEKKSAPSVNALVIRKQTVTN